MTSIDESRLGTNCLLKPGRERKYTSIQTIKLKIQSIVVQKSPRIKQQLAWYILLLFGRLNTN